MSNYDKIVDLVIEHLEGGYYHPDMLKDGRVTDQRYYKSGETMFGIDRVAGGAINYSLAGIKFWKIIDNANARKNWKWNYKGGNLNKELKKLAGEIIKPVFEKLSSQYLSEKSRKLIQTDDALLFNFIYASWNGAGWFKSFATKFNDAVDNKKIRNIKKLREISLQNRINTGNSLIIQGAKKIAEIYKNMPIGTKWQILKVAVGLNLLALGVYVFKFKKQKIKEKYDSIIQNR